MKYKVFKFLLVIAFAILIAFSFVKYLKRGHIVKYKIKGEEVFIIKENQTRNEKNELDNYYIEIEVNNNVFAYQLYDEFDSKHKIVEDVKYFKDENYACVYPIFYGNYQADIKCLKDSIYYSYTNLAGQDELLDEFANSLKKYNFNNYKDNSQKKIVKNNIKIYIDNVVLNHNISITSLKGIYILNKDIKNINIFTYDNYSRPLSVYANDYYITADYNEKHQFRNFYLIDLKNSKKTTIKSDKQISFNSYFQGVVDNQVYLYDIDNEKQYKINLQKKQIIEVENKNKKVRYYKDNNWSDISIVKANNHLYFSNYITLEKYKDYDYVYKYGNKLSGYYYLYKYANNHYEIYRANIQNMDCIEYLFTTNEISSLRFISDYVYFKNNNSIYYYHQTTGIRKVVEFDELQFNDSLKYNIVKK